MDLKKPIGQNKMLGDISREALFNEIKGSLFEYLVARNLALFSNLESAFLSSIKTDYLDVLIKQDLMVRKFYPEMSSFLEDASRITSKKIINSLNKKILAVKLTGKSGSPELAEADIVLNLEDKVIPVSLKLNKRNSFVNTKSAGVKSFFDQYFIWNQKSPQKDFNSLVDFEFERMAREIYSYHDLVYEGNFNRWVELGHSELPGELGKEEREILKSYYSRLALKIHEILHQSLAEDKKNFSDSLLKLMGFGHPDIIQVVCFHEHHSLENLDVVLYDFNKIKISSENIFIQDFQNVASVEVNFQGFILQIRIKPMNKFTTTAIKINCSVKQPRSF